MDLMLIEEKKLFRETSGQDYTRLISFSLLVFVFLSFIIIIVVERHSIETREEAIGSWELIFVHSKRDSMQSLFSFLIRVEKEVESERVDFNKFRGDGVEIHNERAIVFMFIFKWRRRSRKSRSGTRVRSTRRTSERVDLISSSTMKLLLWSRFLLVVVCAHSFLLSSLCEVR